MALGEDRRATEARAGQACLACSPLSPGTHSLTPPAWAEAARDNAQLPQCPPSPRCVESRFGVELKASAVANTLRWASF